MMSSVSSAVIDSAPNTGPKQKYSCTNCQARKVRCDKLSPCKVCQIRGNDCIYKDPLPPRRGKRKIPPENLLARLRRYEELLRNYGANIDELEEESASFSERAKKEGSQDSPHPDFQEDTEQVPVRGKLIVEDGKSRYIENNLWTGMGYELNEDRESSDDREALVLQDTASSQEDEFILGLTTSASTRLSTYHPPPAIIFTLWQIFLRNVDPMIKLFHTPTIQGFILEASGDLNNVPKHVECLMFAIYSAAVNSMSETACFATMNESKANLLAKYQLRCRQALHNAEFLGSSDLIILQAYMIFLTSIRNVWDPSRLWVLVGIAIRMGQRVGLHRDGTSLKLPVFEVEIRRRLWFQIILLEVRAAELSGMRASGAPYAWDTKVPSNANDADLHPDMTHQPIDHAEPTEMIFSLVRCELTYYLRNWKAGASDPSTSTIAAKDKAVDGLEGTLQRRVKLYDPNVPAQLAAFHIAHVGFLKARLIAHHPRQYTDRGASLPQPERDIIFHLALKIITHHNQAENITPFTWYMKFYFQWEVFVYLLEELVVRTGGYLTEEAWEEVRKGFEHHPEIISRTNNRLYVEIGNLTLRAWDAREANFVAGHQRYDTPHFISALRMRVPSTRGSRMAPVARAQGVDIPPTAAGQEQWPTPQMQRPAQPTMQGNGQLAMPLQSSEWISPMDWQYWDGIFQGYDYEQASQGQFEEVYR